MNQPQITPELVASHGLKPDEYERILKLIGRVPSFTELGIFSAMWNEHCSYKSSRLHLRGLPTNAPWVIQGPGENAGVIDIGDGQAVVFKMESHNHPSYIEPYQGATTGVGGILRDVFTMGARPIACLNALSFGAPEHPKTRHLVSGVVAGIGGYGNSFGVPTVGGQVRFHTRYDGNILVNAMAVGLADTDKIFYAAASGVNMPIVYLGSKTGRDGIHGASMASAEFDDDSAERRPTVLFGERPIEQFPCNGIFSRPGDSSHAPASGKSMNAFYSNCSKRKVVVSWQCSRAPRQSPSNAMGVDTSARRDRNSARGNSGRGGPHDQSDELDQDAVDGVRDRNRPRQDSP